MQANDPWGGNRYLENSQYTPFHNRYYANVYELIAGSADTPTLTWYAGPNTNGAITYQGAAVGFTKKPYSYGGGGNNGGL